MRYVHFVDSLVWLRFCLTDFLRPSRKPRTDFEAAVMIAVATERPVATWRTRLRSALATSRFIATFESVGAIIWPKSLTFVARRRGQRPPEWAVLEPDSLDVTNPYWDEDDERSADAAWGIGKRRT
jgi:hypothetical protein